MTFYSKLIAAIVGLLVIIASRYGLDLAGHEQIIIDALVGVGTAIAVWRVPNKPTTVEQVQEVRQEATEANKEIKRS